MGSNQLTSPKTGRTASIRMKPVSAGVFLAVLLVSTFPLILVVNAQSVGSNLLVNADFERGSLDDWDAYGTCSSKQWHGAFWFLFSLCV